MAIPGLLYLEGPPFKSTRSPAIPGDGSSSLGWDHQEAATLKPLKMGTLILQLP